MLLLLQTPVDEWPGPISTHRSAVDVGFKCVKTHQTSLFNPFARAVTRQRTLYSGLSPSLTAFRGGASAGGAGKRFSCGVATGRGFLCSRNFTSESHSLSESADKVPTVRGLKSGMARPKACWALGPAGTGGKVGMST